MVSLTLFPTCKGLFCSRRTFLKPSCFAFCQLLYYSIIPPSLFCGLCIIDFTVPLWLADIFVDVLCSEIDTTLHLNIYQGRVGLRDYFMCPISGSPFGHPPRVSLTSVAVLTHVQLWSRTVPSSCLHNWSAARHSLSSVCTVVCFLSLWYFHCLFTLSCLLYISDNQPGWRNLLKFDSFLTNWHSYSLI